MVSGRMNGALDGRKTFTQRMMIEDQTFLRHTTGAMKRTLYSDTHLGGSRSRSRNRGRSRNPGQVYSAKGSETNQGPRKSTRRLLMLLKSQRQLLNWILRHLVLTTSSSINCLRSANGSGTNSNIKACLELSTSIR